MARSLRSSQPRAPASLRSTLREGPAPGWTSGPSCSGAPCPPSGASSMGLAAGGRQPEGTGRGPGLVEPRPGLGGVETEANAIQERVPWGAAVAPPCADRIAERERAGAARCGVRSRAAGAWGERAGVWRRSVGGLRRPSPVVESGRRAPHPKPVRAAREGAWARPGRTGETGWLQGEVGAPRPRTDPGWAQRSAQGPAPGALPRGWRPLARAREWEVARAGGTGGHPAAPGGPRAEASS